MTDQHHPITPPPELVQQWGREFLYGPPTEPAESHAYIAARAAQWGADQELEACIRLAGEAALPEKDRYFDGLTVADIIAARRPKPPSLKKQALEELNKVDMLWATEEFGQETLNSLDTIRRALEALPDD